MVLEQQFTKYEIARIIGARALQIAMDAPILLKLSKEQLREMKFDALRIAEAELNSGILPIAIHRPQPRRHLDKLRNIKEDQLTDEEIIAKAQEEEREIAADAKEIGLVNEGEAEEETEDAAAETTEEA